MIQKVVFFFFFLFVSLSYISASGSSESDKPSWMDNVDAAYPSSQFIAKRGMGSTPEAAKTNAANELASFFKTNISSNLKTELKDLQTTTNGVTDNSTYESLSETIDVAVNVDLLALEYSEPYFNKKQKTWYCVALINKNKAYEQYSAELDVAKKEFLNLYNNANAETEPYKRICSLLSAQLAAETFKTKFIYASMFANQKVSANYSQDLNVALGLKSIIKAEQLKMPLYLTVNIDSSNQIFSAIAKIFTSHGFTIINANDVSAYTLDAQVNLNESKEKIGDEEVFVTYPDLILSIKSSKVTLYTFNVHTEKNVSFSKNKSDAKACSALAGKITTELSKKVLN